MNRIRMMILAMVAVVLTVVAIPASASSSRPQYATPTRVTAFSMGERFAEAVWATVKYADFYTVDISKSKTMSHPVMRLVTYSTDINAMDLTDLTPNTRYYVTVEVSSSRGESLSHDSKVATFRTDPETR